jgi:TPR repeat protein
VLFTPITDPQERSRAEVHCANGAGGACQRLAVTYGSAGPEERGTASAGRYQRLAIGMFVRACRGSDAVACYALAEMHATGRGMKQSKTKAQALIERAQMLCRINAEQPVCASLVPETIATGGKH